MTIAANGTYVFATLVERLQKGGDFEFWAGNKFYRGKILGISREDGSGRNFNLDVTTRQERLQVFVRCDR